MVGVVEVLGGAGVTGPWQQHEVQVVSSVPLSLVEHRPLLHQVLQVPGIHLQPSDHVVHVALVVLVVNVAAGGGETKLEVRDQLQSSHRLSLANRAIT